MGGEKGILTTENGIAFCLQRLADAPTKEALRTVWGNLGREYQLEPKVRDFKDTLKATFDILEGDGNGNAGR